MCCTVYSNDPIRVRITLDQIWQITHPKGINSTFYPSEEQPENEFYCKLTASDINPHNPIEEKYKEDIEKEMNDKKLNIVQDHIREFYPHRLFNPIKNRIVETVLDEKVFSKDNRYDVLLDKYSKQWHYLPNGKKFGIIEDS